MLDPIFIKNGNFLIHTFGPEEIQRISSIAQDVYAIFSDEMTLKFLPQKRLQSVQQAEKLLKTNLLNFHAGKNYLHFITDELTGRVIGLIDIISPDTAKEHYDFSQYPHFIEFYLAGANAGKLIMSKLLPVFIEVIRGQNLKQLGAVVHRHNVSSIKVLKRSGFKLEAGFDSIQDFYKISFD